MENLESVLEEIEKFDRNASSEDDLSGILEEYLRFVSKTGDPIFPWHRIKNLVRHKLSAVMTEFYSSYGGEDIVETTNTPPFSYAPTKNKILQHFDSFTGAPFTIQRLCEILIEPMKHYKRTDKFLRGIEKNILVVSSVEPGHAKRMAEQQLNLVNGLQEPGSLHFTLESTTTFNKENTPPKALPAENDDVEMSDEQMNGNITSNGIGDDSSSSSSSSSSSTSSSPTPDEDSHELGPSAKRPRLEHIHVEETKEETNDKKVELDDDFYEKSDDTIETKTIEDEITPIKKGMSDKTSKEAIAKEKVKSNKVSSAEAIKSSDHNAAKSKIEVGTSTLLLLSETTEDIKLRINEVVSSAIPEVDSSMEEDGNCDQSSPEHISNASSCSDMIADSARNSPPSIDLDSIADSKICKYENSEVTTEKSDETEATAEEELDEPEAAAEELDNSEATVESILDSETCEEKLKLAEILTNNKLGDSEASILSCDSEATADNSEDSEATAAGSVKSSVEETTNNESSFGSSISDQKPINDGSEADSTSFQNNECSQMASPSSPSQSTTKTTKQIISSQNTLPSTLDHTSSSSGCAAGIKDKDESSPVQQSTQEIIKEPSSESDSQAQVITTSISEREVETSSEGSPKVGLVQDSDFSCTSSNS